ncbi:MAG: ATP-binding protein [Ancrocorticia sp.]
MIPRPTYLEQIRPFIGTNVIKVLVGVRRCGKSSLLKLVQQELLNDGVAPTHLISINLESAEFQEISDSTALIHAVASRVPTKLEGRVHIFLDEVQEVTGWEKAVRSFLVDYDADIYVTGSNAHLLSSDLATHITGRYVTINVFPFSFKEFFGALKEHDDIDRQQAFTRYLNQGGFPFQTELGFRPTPIMQYLQDLYSTILLRDIVEYASVRDVDQLQRIVRYAIAEEGHLLTPRKIANYLKSERRSVAQETVANYLRAAQAAFLLYQARREDVAGKRHLQFNEKYYVVDQGLRQAIGMDNGANIDQVLEGIVYMELLRRGYEVTVGSVGDREVDFVARRNGLTEYYQVTYLLATPDVVAREFGALAAINDNHPKYVLSMDPIARSEAGMRGLNIVDWLLEAS